MSERSDIELGWTVTHRSVSSEMVKDPSFLKLMRSVFGEHQGTTDAENRLLTKCHVWYLKLIDAWIEAAWQSLLEPGLSNQGSSLDSPCSTSGAISAGKRRVYDLTSRVAALIKSRERKELALTEIVMILRDEGHLSNGSASHESLYTQIAFTLIGWVTMLYHPVPDPESNKLQLERPAVTRRPRLRRTDIIHNFSLDISTQGRFVSMTQQPFHRLLQRFGALIPCIDDVYANVESAPRDYAHSLKHWGGDRYFDSTITVQHVCFHTLRKIVGIRIQWVETLNLHLEFDPGKKILKLFRYPAFCWWISRNTEFGDGLLNRLFEEKWEEGNEPSIQCYGVNPRPDDFFQEVLLSYRLIFGQDRRSQQAYRRDAAKRGREQRNGDNGTGNPRLPPDDPLLPLLCGQKWSSPESRAIYQAINLDDDVSKTYAATDFPFLGKKLLQLQQFSKNQYPHGWLMLWHDRRNLSEWWTIWAVLFIGGGTIIIAIVTLAFQIMQAVYGARGNGAE